ncbi:MAG: three-Cys-motif partner protein TcmP [Parvularculaceae bacterium]
MGWVSKSGLTRIAILAKKSHSENTVGPWAAEKLGALGAYLEYYTTRLKNQRQWQKIYVDAFAGPGVSQLRSADDGDFGSNLLFDLDVGEIAEAESYLKGSPQVALGITNPFDHYVFIERDSVRAATLRDLVSEKRNAHSITLLQGDAGDELARLSRRIRKGEHRAVVFIDPYGLNISWNAIEALAKTGAVEIVLNFAWAMAINRLLVRNGNIPPNWIGMLDNYFGDHHWYSLAYEKSEELFGQKLKKAPRAEEKILEYYVDKLRTCFGFVAPPMLIRNTRRNPLYYLIWAGPNAAGLEGAKHILSQGEIVEL